MLIIQSTEVDLQSRYAKGKVVEQKVPIEISRNLLIITHEEGCSVQQPKRCNSNNNQD